jgi:hypothetical protein
VGAGVGVNTNGVGGKNTRGVGGNGTNMNSEHVRWQQVVALQPVKQLRSLANWNSQVPVVVTRSGAAPLNVLLKSLMEVG